MDEPVGEVLYEQTRGELAVHVYHARANTTPGSYLTVQLPEGRDHQDLLCIIEGPLTQSLPPRPGPSGATLSLRVVGELRPETARLTSYGVARGRVFGPPLEFLRELFTGHFYSPSKKAQVSVEIPLVIGELRNYEEPIPVMLLGEEMNSHTCVFAQSGAGKSYAVGVMLEQLA